MTSRYVSSAILALALTSSSIAQEIVTDNAVKEPKAVEIATATLERMGGAEKWDATRYLVWDSFGQRHYWDKWTGDFRWERDSLTVVMNILTMEGRAWINGRAVEAGEELDGRLTDVYGRWVNNMYWLAMPYKLLDPGVNLKYIGEDSTQSGQMADVLELTFENVGLTPNNRYDVYIDKESGLVCQWSHYRNREDEEPLFTRPWTDWKEYNGIMLSTGRGGGRQTVTMLDVPDELPPEIFAGL